MAPKRLPLSFPELEPKGRRAILRTPEEIKAENRVLELDQPDPKAATPERQDVATEKNDQTNQQTKERPNDRPNEQANERRAERNNEQLVERAKARHSFDVYKDQLLGLNELQTKAFRATGRKPGISELVQEALDKYLSIGTGKDV